MIAAVQALLRGGFDRAERALDRLVGPQANPLAQLGALGYFFFWIVAVSGLYLFVFFDTGVTRAFESVAWMSGPQWWHAGVVRSFHRYASDLMIVTMFLHLMREFSLDRFRGARWFSWFSGIPLIAFLYVSGITGYWLVWDKLAQYVAITSTELLDWMPIFGEPIARNFLDATSLSSRFFTLLVFLHIAAPIALLFAMWVHIQRISRPRVNPPRLLGGVVLFSLLAVSLLMPAHSQEPANLAQVPSPVKLDSLFLALYPLADRAPGAAWAGLAAFGLLMALAPFLPRRRQPAPAKIFLDHCNGCGRCVDDCPYEALRLTRRTDGAVYLQEAIVDPSKCVSCGICVGSCPSSTPFRRSQELVTGIDLPDYPLVRMRQDLIANCAAMTEGPRILAISCPHGAGKHLAPGPHLGVLELPCVAMAPPSLIDFALSRGHADGVAVIGCAESSCYNRLGVDWTEQRFAHERDPYLRARVPRERLATIWASTTQKGAMNRSIEALRARIAGLEAKNPSPEPAAPQEEILS
ncbi:MAG: cytochrome b N-terminal domain-containing protein [Rhodoblastus sp.]